MRIKKYCITLILLLFGVGVAHSQEKHTEICIDFRVNSTVIDSAYSDNAARMQEMGHLISPQVICRQLVLKMQMLPLLSRMVQ